MKIEFLRQDIRYHQTIEYLLAYRKTNQFVPPRRENERDVDNDYKFEIEIIGSPIKIETIGGYDIEIYLNNSYRLTEVKAGEGSLKSYSIRGSLITQSGSASEFYEKNLRQRKLVDGYSSLYKVINMGTRGDGIGYRYIMQPPHERVRNGTYFQGKPIKSKLDQGLPYPNFFDFVNDFNNVGYEGGIEFKNGKKPINFLKKVFELANLGTDSMILDFFAGSGSTLHATMQKNEEDGGTRQCVLITNNENNICEKITYERNKLVIKGYSNIDGEIIAGLPKNNFRYYKNAFVNRDPSLKNKIQLTKLATELLCIKENCYETYDKGIPPKSESWLRVFHDAREQYLFIMYDDSHIQECVAFLQQFIESKQPEKKIKVYVFSNGQYPYTEDFEDVLANIALCALPDAIYKAYLNVLPKRKRIIIPEIEEATTQEVENAIEAYSDFFNQAPKPE